MSLVVFREGGLGQADGRVTSLTTRKRFPWCGTVLDVSAPAAAVSALSGPSRASFNAPQDLPKLRLVDLRGQAS